MLVRHTTALRGALVLLAVVTAGAQEAVVREKEGQVVVTKSGAAPVAAVEKMSLAARDQLATAEASRAVLQMSERWFARIDEETNVEITPRALGAKDRDALRVALGGVFVYSREAEGELKIVTPSATGGLRGTQLVVRVWPGGRTAMQVLEGEVDLANEHGRVLLAAGEAGEAEPGQAPRKTAALEAKNLLQWVLYYPAVLGIEEFGLGDAEQRDLQASLDAYRGGDLLGALAGLSSAPPPASSATRLYHAAVRLATGRVPASRALLQGVDSSHPGRAALERLVAAVLQEDAPTLANPASAGEAIAESYLQQSRQALAAARGAAQRATTLAPASGFAWTRLAELEFTFGNTREARRAVERALTLTPRNAQARALEGFLLSADNQIAAAQAAFEAAVQLDGGLGNAWLGLGLAKIRQGRLDEGRTDLQTAVTVEPTRSFLYSYHAKALSQQGRDPLAEKDLLVAQRIDPRDPTPWLYAAVQHQLRYRYNDAIGDLQESLRLNDNRSVYRSRFLLDGDRAIRRTNLAAIYRNNGMADLSLREATAAVDNDPTNASAHLFLADSYDAMRDPQRLLLRHETAWFNELLLANLLAPVGGGPLSQFVSQQEYSQLFEADGRAGSVAGEARDGGYLDLQSYFSVTQGRFSTGVTYLRHEDPGSRANNDTRHEEYYWQAKYQVAPSDVVYALVKGEVRKGGDLQLNAANTPASTSLRFADKQEPGLALVGWNRRWAPGVHTLFLGGRLAARQTLRQDNSIVPLVLRDTGALVPGFYDFDQAGQPVYASPELQHATTPPVSTAANGALVLSPAFQRLIAPFLGRGPALAYSLDTFTQATHRQFEIYSAEVQQLWHTEHQTFLAGARWQSGEISADTRLGLALPSTLYQWPPAQQHVSGNFHRHVGYLYEYFRILPTLNLVAGLTADAMEWPENFRSPPVSARPRKDSRASGKMGFTWQPRPGLTLRGAVTQSRGGVTYDESVRLEPVQVAGFDQAFRTVISEAFAGSVEAPLFRNAGLNLSGAWSRATWWSVAWSRVTEDVTRTIGAFDFFIEPIFGFPGFAALPAGTTQQLHYQEREWKLGLNHLVGDELSVGLSFRRTQAALASTYPQVPAISGINTRDDATLQELAGQLYWNAPGGWFARAEAGWFRQEAAGTTVGSTSRDSFGQVNVQAGHRFQRNRHEIAVGVLNLTDTPYHLNPLTYTRALARERTAFVRCRFSF